MSARSADWGRAQGFFERRCRAREVAPRERGLSEADEHRRHLRGQLTRALEERLRLVCLALIQIAAAQPDQRRHVVRADLEHSIERGNRPGGVALALVQMRQEVRPSRLLRHQRLRVEVGGLGRVVVLAGLQQHADAAVRPAALLVGRAGLLDRLEHRLVALRAPAPARRIHARQVRQGDLEHRRRRRRRRRRLTRTNCIRRSSSTSTSEQRAVGSWALGSWELASLHFPLPCFSVTQRSIA